MDLRELQRLVEELSTESLHLHELELTTTNGTKATVQLVDSTRADTGRNLLALHRLMLLAVRDYPRLAQATVELVELVAAQQRRIAELEADVQRVRQERVAVAVQEQANVLLENLADRGYSTGEQEFTVRLEEEEQLSSEHQRMSMTEEAGKKDVRGKIAGLAKHLAGLELNVKIDERAIQQDLETARSHADRTKKVNLSWRIRGVAAPQDPKAHTDAYLQRKEAERRLGDAARLAPAPPQLNVADEKG